MEKICSLLLFCDVWWVVQAIPDAVSPKPIPRELRQTTRQDTKKLLLLSNNPPILKIPNVYYTYTKNPSRTTSTDSPTRGPPKDSLSLQTPASPGYRASPERPAQRRQRLAYKAILPIHTTCSPASGALAARSKVHAGTAWAAGMRQAMCSSARLGWAATLVGVPRMREVQQKATPPASVAALPCLLGHAALVSVSRMERAGLRIW